MCIYKQRFASFFAIQQLSLELLGLGFIFPLISRTNHDVVNSCVVNNSINFTIDYVKKLQEELLHLKRESFFYKQMFNMQQPTGDKPAANELLNKVAPSSIQWTWLEEANLVPSFQIFLTTVRAALQTNVSAESAISVSSQPTEIETANKYITKYSSPTNEGFPTLLWGNDFAALTHKLNEKSLPEMIYSFEVYPVMCEDPDDHWHDFKADFNFILKLKTNSRTLIICELKLTVSLQLADLIGKLWHNCCMKLSL